MSSPGPLRWIGLLLLLGLTLPDVAFAQIAMNKHEGAIGHFLSGQISVQWQGLPLNDGVQCRPHVDFEGRITVYPAVFHPGADEQWEVFVQYDPDNPSPDGATAPYEVVVICELIEDLGNSNSVPFTVEPGRRLGTAPHLIYPDDRIRALGKWWPLILDRYNADPEVQLPDDHVEWQVIGADASFLNPGSTRFDSNESSANMIRVESNTPDAQLWVLTRFKRDPIEERFDFIHLVNLNPDGTLVYNQGVDLDPRFSTSDGRRLHVRPDTRGTLRFRFAETDGPALGAGNFVFAASWDGARVERFWPQPDKTPSVISATFEFPSEGTNEGPLVLVAWAEEADGFQVASKEIEIDLGGELPSIYGCSQAPRSEGHLALALLLLGLTGVAGRGRRMRRSWANLLSMRASRLLPGALLLGALLCGLWPTPARAQLAIEMEIIRDHPLGLGEVVQPGIPVAIGVAVTGQNPGASAEVHCDSLEPDIFLIHPDVLEVPDGAQPRIYAEIKANSTGFPDNAELPITCELVADNSVTTTLDPGFSLVEPGRAPGFQVEEGQDLRAGLFWPIVLTYEDELSANRYVEWHSLTGGLVLFNQISTNFDTREVTANMVRLEPSTRGESLVLVWVRNNDDPAQDVAMIISLGKPDPALQDREFDLDPKFETYDDLADEDLALGVKLERRGSLRLRAFEASSGKNWETVDLGKAVWTANWPHAVLEPFVPRGNGGHTTSSSIVSPPPGWDRQGWESRTDTTPTSLLIWAKEEDAQRYAIRRIEVEFTDELPSIYGCSSTPGSGAPLALALLLGLLLVGRGRPACRRMAILLAGGLLLPATALAGDAEPKKPGLAFTGVVAPPNANPDEVKAISEYLQTELIARGYYQVVGPGEIQALMGLEAQKQLLGCSESSAACLAEVGGALGSDRLLSGNVTRVGKSVILSLSLLDVQSARLIHRAGERVKVTDSLEPLLDVVPKILDEVISRDSIVVASAGAAGTPSPGAPPTPPTSPATTGAGDPTVVATASGIPPTRSGELGDPPPATTGPGGPAATGPHPLARAHRGAGTFLVNYHHEVTLPLGGVFGLGLRWRRGLVGATLSVQGHPGTASTQPERVVGLRLGVRLYPKDLGRVAPFLGGGVSLMLPTVLPRLEAGAEIALGNFRVTGTVAVEFLANDLAFYSPLNLLFGLGVGYAF